MTIPRGWNINNKNNKITKIIKEITGLGSVKTNTQTNKAPTMIVLEKQYLRGDKHGILSVEGKQ
jgi:hypothetical protein